MKVQSEGVMEEFDAFNRKKNGILFTLGHFCDRINS